MVHAKKKFHMHIYMHFYTSPFKLKNCKRLCFVFAISTRDLSVSNISFITVKLTQVFMIALYFIKENSSTWTTSIDEDCILVILSLVYMILHIKECTAVYLYKT